MRREGITKEVVSTEFVRWSQDGIMIVGSSFFSLDVVVYYLLSSHLDARTTKRRCSYLGMEYGRSTRDGGPYLHIDHYLHIIK
jgi:hypothetical protein